MNNEIIAYAAGVFDADGTIQINKRRDCDSYQVSVSVSSVVDAIPCWLLRNFGGKIYHFYSSKERRQPIQRWTLYSLKVLDFLKVIEPYLTEKRERAKLAIHFQSNLFSKNNQKVHDAIRLERKNVFNQMKTLNAKFGRNHWIGAKLEEVN